jgi:hypothetical protein
MTNLRVVAVVLTIVGACSVAAASEFREDFESYTAGSALHGRRGWKGWNNAPEAGAPVSGLYAFSGSNSVEIFGLADLVHEFALAGGKWEFSAMQYIPEGTTGNTFFILLNTYNDGGPYDWSVQLNFSLDAGVITSEILGGGATANILYDQWVELKFIIDLDNDTVDEYYNGTLICTHEWDDNDHGTLAAIDLWASNASSIYYDDITLVAPPCAYNPDPADGVIYESTWANLSWTLGAYAVSHDVYLGENFDDVNDGAEITFQGNQAATNLVIGFPGFPYPAGLVPGTTYYWRVDEVNEVHPDSPWKGDVWSFLLPPKSAYNPNPVDGTTLADPNTDLSWAAGLKAVMHVVYFGTDADAVANAVGGSPQTDTDFEPGTLQAETTYHWRVDDFDGTQWRTGRVWSFTTAPLGMGGVRREIWENIAGTDLDALKSDPRFPWAPTVVDEVPDFLSGPYGDNYGGRLQAWLYVPLAGDYTFWVAGDSNTELWLGKDPSSAQLIASVPNWSNQREYDKYPQQKSEPIALEADRYTAVTRPGKVQVSLSER